MRHNDVGARVEDDEAGARGALVERTHERRYKMVFGELVLRR